MWLVLTQAVLEGVAFAFRDSLHALEAAGTELHRVTAVGGGSRSHYWLKAHRHGAACPVDIRPTAISALPSAPPASA